MIKRGLKMKIEFIKNGIQTDAVCDLGFKLETVHLLTSDLFTKSINVNTYELKELLKVSYLCAIDNEFYTQFKKAVRDGLLRLHSSFSTKITTAEEHHYISVGVLYSAKFNKLGILFHIKSEHLSTREYDMSLLSVLSNTNNDSIRSQANTIIRDVFSENRNNEIFKNYNNYDIVRLYELLIDKAEEALIELKDNYNNYLDYQNYNK